MDGLAAILEGQMDAGARGSEIGRFDLKMPGGVMTEPRSASSSQHGLSPNTKIHVPGDELRRVETGLLVSLGLSDEDAAQCADVFIQSDLRGEESHGARLFLH